MAKENRDSENWELLTRYWRRHPFHDRQINSVWAGNRRVVIRLEGLVLVVTGTSTLKRCELPAVWLYESLTTMNGDHLLDIETDTGHLIVSGKDVRLLGIGQTGDCYILIPPIDV